MSITIAHVFLLCIRLLVLANNRGRRLRMIFPQIYFSGWLKKRIWQKENLSIVRGVIYYGCQIKQMVTNATIKHGSSCVFFWSLCKLGRISLAPVPSLWNPCSLWVHIGSWWWLKGPRLRVEITHRQLCVWLNIKCGSQLPVFISDRVLVVAF